jgi:hypothetical protein
MNKQFLWSVKVCIFSCLFFLSVTVYGQRDSAKALRLFLIGNSFSGNASRYLPKLAKEGGFTLTIGRAELGGCPLQRHWELVEADEANDPKGKAYNGKSLKALLSEGKWDVVTIQQASVLSGDSTTYQPYAKKLFDFIRRLQPEANIVIHQTWPYRSDAPSFTQVATGAFAKTATDMWERSRAAYHRVAAALGINMLPVGDAFQLAATQKSTAYHKDANFQPEHSTYPALPLQTNSLHVGYYYDKDHKLVLDTHHANAAGCYLAGLIWYRFLFKVLPTSVHFKPEEVDDTFAAQLKEIAQKVM